MRTNENRRTGKGIFVMNEQQRQALAQEIEAAARRGAARDQVELVSLLRTAQAACGGVLYRDVVLEIAQALGLKVTFLEAVLKRYPSIRTDQAPHVLTVCQGPNCARGGQLADFVRRTYQVEPGGVAGAGFRFQVSGCMKHCGSGPNVKWDGQVYHQMTPEALRRLVEQGG